MEIKDILDTLGLDFSNPEVKRGAIDAIEAILNSRATIDLGGDFGGGGVGGTTTEIELDPDLLQPSVKQTPPDIQDDIEVEDEDNILDQIRHKESENDNAGSSSGSEAKSNDDSTSNSSSSDATSGSAGNSDAGAPGNDSGTKSDDSSEAAGNQGKNGRFVRKQRKNARALRMLDNPRRG